MFLCFLLSASHTSAQLSVEWLISDFLNTPSENIAIIGSPKLIESPYGAAVLFNGVDDGIFLDYTPLLNLEEFTIEVIMRPDKGGSEEQRFLHMGEMHGDRVMFETRLTNDFWYLDAYIQSGEIKLAMIDSTKLYPLGEWYNFTLVNKNGELEVFLNGKREFKEIIQFTPFTDANTSIGVRQNKVHWYKGAFYKIKITPKAIFPDEFLSF